MNLNVIDWLLDVLRRTCIISISVIYSILEAKEIKPFRTSECGYSRMILINLQVK